MRTRVAALLTCAILTPGLVARVKAEEKEATKMTFEYGFRYDPMNWVESDDSLNGALVRRYVFHKPNPGDEEILEKRIKEILGEQNEDGTLSDDPRHRYQFTCEALSRLADLGVGPAREEVRRAVDAVLRERDEESADPIGIYTIRALCQLGMGDRPEVKEGLERLVARQEEWNDAYAGCPWTPIEHLQTLWMGREVLDATELIEGALTWIAEGMNSAGCLSYKDPWGFLRIAGFVELPVARRIVARQIPMILRGQEPDGGWGDRSLSVFRALVSHGLLEPLRGLDRLPPDWRIVCEIPAPESDLETMTHDGERLWVHDRADRKAIALSPDDGRVLALVSLPEGKCVGLGWWEDGLGVTQADPKRLLKVDPETGEVTREVPLDFGEWINGVAQVDREVWIADGFMGCVWRVNNENPDQHSGLVLAGPCPVDLAATAEGVWHSDVWAPAIIKTDFQGTLLDWGEKPFDGRCDGIAWDGKHLWALDRANKRICIIEKTASGKQLARDLGVAQMENAHDTEGSQMNKIENLECADRVTSHMGAIEGCLKYLGMDITPGWLYGGTGNAFVMCVGTDLCPSGPHCWHYGKVHELARNLGVKIEHFPARQMEGSLEDKQPKAWEFIRKAIDDGAPLCCWHWEHLVINGYDGDGFLYSGPLRRDHKHVPWEEFGTAPCGLETWTVQPGEKADDRTVIRETLSFALEFAASPEKLMLEGYGGGSAGYDNWITGLESGEVSPDGAASHAIIWAECRRFALEFLREANRRTDKQFDELFRPAIERYRVVRDNLKTVAELFPWGDDGEMKRRVADPERRQKAVDALRTAKEAEAAGLDALKSVVAAL